MKTHFIAIVLLAIFILGILPGCGTASARQPDAPVKPTETPPSDVPTTANEPASTPTEPQRITPEEAEAIALKAAGLSRNQVTRLKAEFDYDDGVPEYDVDFHCDGWEYSYEIHAESGKILSNDREPDE